MMPARLLTATPSRLAAFDDCPRRYRMAYLDRPRPAKGGPWAHNTVGAVAHLALGRWWGLRTVDRTPEAAGRLAAAAWSDDGFRDAEQSARWKARTAAMVAGYAAELDPADEPVGIERSVAATTATLALSGRVDRIDDRGAELVVVDYKTGRFEPDDYTARASRALAIYVLGVRRTLRRACRRVELHHLPTGRVAAWEHDDATLARHVARAESTAADIVAATDTVAAGGDPDAVFDVRTGTHCAFCDFRRHCAPGRAATPDREPWSALPED